MNFAHDWQKTNFAHDTKRTLHTILVRILHLFFCEIKNVCKVRSLGKFNFKKEIGFD